MRRNLVILASVLALSIGGPSFAQSQADVVRDRVIAELRDDGYRQIRISRTLLGRMRFVADGPEARREIVVNPATGVILRDFIRFKTDETGGSESSGQGAFGLGEEDVCETVLGGFINIGPYG